MKLGHTRCNDVRMALAALLVIGCAWLALAGQAVAVPGQIGYDGCLASIAAEGCADLPGGLLVGAHTVAVSPDGSSVYVASSPSGSIAHFVAGGPDGQIAYEGCLASTAAPNCADLPSGLTATPHGPSSGAPGRSTQPSAGSLARHPS